MHINPENYFSLKHIQASIVKGVHSANLRPFHTIEYMYRGKYLTAEFQYKNLGGNLLGFVPLGIFLPLLFRRLRSFTVVVAFVFMISLGYELIQLCTGLGFFDIDDIILNTAGGMIGYILHFFASIIYRQPLVKTSAEA